MSSEAITRNDLKAVLDEVLPVEPSEYKKLLWTNPNPTSSFSAQTISLDLSGYDEVEIYVRRMSSETGIVQVAQASVSYGASIGGVYGADTLFRKATVSVSGIQFTDGYFNGSSNNTYMIPYKIYGIKYERVAPPQVDASTYVVEHGTDGQWTYRKWSDGTYEATYTAGFALNAGTSWAGGYYHKTTYGIALPSFATSWYLKSAQKSDSILAWCVGAQNESDGLHFVWQNGSAPAVSGANFVNTIVTICGNWQ